MKLNTLFADSTSISKLDVTNNPNLEQLTCGNTGLTELDVTPVSSTHLKKDFNYFFLKGNKYFFRSCKEMETIFYHYAENHPFLCLCGKEVSSLRCL